MSNAGDFERVLLERLVEAIDDHAFPGAVLAVGSSEGLDFLIPAGTHTYEAARAVRTDDLFDLASLTKVVGTTSVAMRLHDQGILDLDAPVARHLTEFATDAMRACITPRHLLAHCSGLPAWAAFHAEKMVSKAQRRKQVLSTPLECAPGTRTNYSDIGMMVLGVLLEELSSVSLDELVQREVCQPLGMAETMYCPPLSFRPRIVPTECKTGGTPLHGVVHDENARWFGGIAGHAGLFSTAKDLSRLCACLLRNGDGFVSSETIQLFIRPANIVPESSRCLGWHGIEENCSGGRRLGVGSYGHTGFTGTSIWIDPETDRFVVLLTNAVHPKRECKSQGFFPWRRAIHDAVYAALIQDA